MKIVLIHPSPKIWTKAALVPLGLAYIASYLEKNGFGEIEVIDYNVEPKASLPKCDVVGITATTPLIKSAWKIAEKAKKMGAVTVIGGPHVSALPLETVKLSFVDYVCVGEGEQTMLEICQALKLKKSFEKIKGIYFRKNGKVIFTSPRPFINDLDSLPFPAYHFFKLEKYTSSQPLISIRRPAMGILTSRGCPFGCHFCYKGTFGRTWRRRSVENVLKEWEYLVKVLKVKEIALMDDGFNTDIKRALSICREIKKRGLTIPWRAHNGIRADRAPLKLLRAMKESGCYMISFGVESGVQRVLDMVGKNLKIKEVEKTFLCCKKLGILTMAFFMIGNPGETEEEIKKTIDFSLKLDTDLAQFSIATPFPGTRIFEMVRKDGKVRVNNWDKYSQFDQRGYFDYKNMEAKDIPSLANLAYRRFYLRPKTILKLAKRRETWLNMGNILAGGSHYLLQKDL